MIKASFTQGKVRDIYDLGDKLLLIATDRISAYDSILPTTIPFKGEILTALSVFWLGRLEGVCPHHLISTDTDSWPEIELDKDYLKGRTMLVKKAEVVPIECVVRGYLAGSSWNEYQAKGEIAGHKLPMGMKEAEEFSEPLFTPSTKAAGGHDQNISISEMRESVGERLAEQLIKYSLLIYGQAAAFAKKQGIIIADTKFEFGIINGEVTLIDEVLTPDSSRFWSQTDYEVGKSQMSFDKQFVRDYLDETGWDHQPPAPDLPDDIIKRTSAKYIEAYEMITGEKFQKGSDLQS